jgi:phage-related protein (TIGR01555 family)
MFVIDSLKSLVTGLGGAKDKTTTQSFGYRFISPDELNAMHRCDWLAAKIVDIIPDDMTREWRDWQAEGPDIEFIEEVENKFNIPGKVTLALKKARLFGGACIVIGIKGAGDPSKELNLDRVGKDSLEYLHVLSCHDITAGPIERDVVSPFFGEPSYYEVNSRNGFQARVHPSRVVRFIGVPILDERSNTAEAWGDSILQRVYEAVQNASSAQAHIAALIPEAKQDIIYIPGLSEYAKTTSGQATLTNRFTYANAVKSMFNMLLLDGTGAPGSNGKDAGEKWEQKQISFAQLPELMQQFLKIASGAADITLMRLLQDAPSGLGSNGDNAMRGYYDNISARQRSELTPAMTRLDEVIIRTSLGARDPSIYYTWSPLWTLSETEKATIFSTKATAVKTLADAGLIPIDALSDAIVNRLIEDGDLPGLEAAIEEYGRLSEQEPDLEEQASALALKAQEVALANPQPSSSGAKPTPKATSDESFFLGSDKKKHHGGGGHHSGSQHYNPLQPRGEGGKWIETGAGDPVKNVAASIVSVEGLSGGKFTVSQIHGFAVAPYETLGTMEKKALHNYQFVLNIKQAQSEDLFNAKKLGLSAPPPHPNPALQAAEFASPGPKYPAGTIMDLANKHPSQTSIYEKGLLAKYDYALKAQKSFVVDTTLDPITGPSTLKITPYVPKVAPDPSFAPPAPTTHIPSPVAPAPHLAPPATPPAPAVVAPHPDSPESLKAFTKIGSLHYGMQPETAKKLATGEWLPDPAKSWQVTAAAQGKEYLKTGKLPGDAYNVPGSVVTPATKSPGLAHHLENTPPPATPMGSQLAFYRHTSKLTASETKGVKSYTGSSSFINDLSVEDHFRHGSGTPNDMSNGIDGALQKSVAKEDLVLMRGVKNLHKWTGTEPEHLTPGHKFTDKAYVSTTTSAHTAENFAWGGYGVKINVPKGSNIMGVQSISHFNGEHEFLLPRGSEFKVIDIDHTTKIMRVDLVS